MSDDGAAGGVFGDERQRRDPTGITAQAVDEADFDGLGAGRLVGERGAMDGR